MIPGEFDARKSLLFAGIVARIRSVVGAGRRRRRPACRQQVPGGAEQHEVSLN